MVTKTKKRCPIGQRKDKKTRKCVGTIKKRCPNGKHRDRKTEKCKNKRTLKKKSSNAEKRVFEIPEMRRKILGYITDCHKGNVAKYHEIESIINKKYNLDKRTLNIDNMDDDDVSSNIKQQYTFYKHMTEYILKNNDICTGDILDIGFEVESEYKCEPGKVIVDLRERKSGKIRFFKPLNIFNWQSESLRDNDYYFMDATWTPGQYLQDFMDEKDKWDYPRNEYEKSEEKFSNKKSFYAHRKKVREKNEKIKQQKMKETKNFFNWLLKNKIKYKKTFEKLNTMGAFGQDEPNIVFLNSDDCENGFIGDYNFLLDRKGFKKILLKRDYKVIEKEKEKYMTKSYGYSGLVELYKKHEMW